jgi:hypothetical protein
MISKLVDGVCRAISGEFGEEYHIYTEKQEQHFTRPCFFAEVTKSGIELFRGNRYYMQNGLKITYYPKYEGKNEDMTAVMQRLMSALDCIEVDGYPMENNGMSGVFDGNSAVLNIEFNFFVKMTAPSLSEDSEVMEEYKLGFKEV